MQPDRDRLVGYWLAVADQDLRLANAHRDDEPNAACFHAQQAAEKALKALLVRLAGDVARTYVAGELAAELAEAGRAPSSDVQRAAVTLDRYYTGTRYPDAMGDADPTMSYFEIDARGAIDQAEVVSAWVRAALASSNSEEPSAGNGG